jgi:two-component system, LytTR family, response regulator
MKILIVEDEPLVARDLQNLLMRIEPNAKVQSVLSSVETARKWFSNNPPPDLILSDIQLSDGISFDIYEDLNLNCPIIFTTAYDEYAIRAFKLNSIDYLLKPVDGVELAKALAKYRSLSGENIIGEQLKTFFSGWNHGGNKKFKERFLTLHRNTLVPVNVSDIAYFCKEELIWLHTTANEKFISEHHTLDEIESLVDPEVFYRVNRQFIIHIQSVGKIRTTHKGLTIQLKPPFNTEIDISREKAASFKSWIG